MSSKRRPHVESPTASFASLPLTSTSPLPHQSKKLKTSSSPKLPAFVPDNAGTSEYLSEEVPPDSAASAVLTSPEVKEESWTKVVKRKMKKVRKVEARLDGSPPRFFYVNSEILKRKEAVGISDIRDLVLHLLGEASPQLWLKVDNRNAIQKVVTLFVPGLLPEHLVLPPLPTSATANPNLPLPIPLPPAPESQNAFTKSPVTVKTLFGGEKTIVHQSSLVAGPQSAVTNPKLPFVARTFSHACPTRAPGDTMRMHSVLSAFFQGPISADEKRRRALGTAKVSSSDASGNPSRYVLTPAQMLANEYPLPTYMADGLIGMDVGDNSGTLGEGWVETPSHPGDGAGLAVVYAVDCEMCLTEQGKELTRACVIEYSTGRVVIDRLVKPPRKILDYLTRWSGITEEALRDVEVSLEDVQKEFLDILTSSVHTRTPILLGHSLESDLKALKLAHPLCIDTALSYHHPKGRPAKPGLAWLVRKWCGREIQNRGEGGHDAEEDARACIELLERKVKGGPTFGEFKADYESIFERLARGRSHPRTAVIDRGNPSTWHGSGATVCLGCANDEEVLAGVLANVDSSDFMWARFTGLAEAQGWIQPKHVAGDSEQTVTDALSKSPVSISEEREKTIDEALAKLDAHLASLHAALPPRTAFVLFTGHGDPRQMSLLQTRKSSFENAVRGGGGAASEPIPNGVSWTMSDGRELEEAVEKAKRGLLFLCLI